MMRFVFLLLMISAAANADKIITAEELERTAPASRAFDVYGPLGAYGPLGTLGPIGNSAWNPSAWMKIVGDWSGIAKLLTSLGGPLSENGPLGKNGPLGESYKNFPEEFKAGGAYGVLGPAGPLGALGPLGPLGPLGAHGFATDRNGLYHDDRGATVSGVHARYDGKSTRVFSLFEVMQENFATKGTNDTSVMILGEIEKTGGVDMFSFVAARDEFVTVLVVPEKQLDDFELALAVNGKVAAVSAPKRFINFMQLSVPAGTKLKVGVKLRDTDHILSHSYRLVVLGAPKSALNF